MSIDKNLFYLQSTSNLAAGLDDEEMDFVLNLEVLNRCAHHCPGCFVNRKNAIEDIDLSTALKLAKDLTGKGMRFREVIISPTDIFSAANAIDVLVHPEFQELLRLHPKTRITTTAMFENMDWNRFEQVFAILDNPEFYRENMILELLVPMNIEKVLSYDEHYAQDIYAALDYLSNKTPKEVDWSFVVNVHEDPNLMDRYEELTNIVKDRFGTTIEFLPSFFRTGNDIFIKQHLEIWKQFIRNTVTEENYRHICLSIADKEHNALNTMVLNYRKGKMLISPFIYEQIVFDYDDLELQTPDYDSAVDITLDLYAKQMVYALKTDECAECDYLMTCMGRNVLSFMEIKNIKSCIYPKEVLDLYHNNGVDARTPRIVRCADNNE